MGTQKFGWATILWISGIQLNKDSVSPICWACNPKQIKNRLNMFVKCFILIGNNCHLYVVVADFGAHPCPRGLNSETGIPAFAGRQAQVACHQTPPCNMYYVELQSLFSCKNQ